MWSYVTICRYKMTEDDTWSFGVSFVEDGKIITILNKNGEVVKTVFIYQNLPYRGCLPIMWEGNGDE